MRNNIYVRNNKLIHPFLFIYYILIPTLHKKTITKLPTIIFATRFFHDFTPSKKSYPLLNKRVLFFTLLTKHTFVVNTTLYI